MAGMIKRGKTYYAVYTEAGKERRRSLETGARQLAKERLRRLESRLDAGLPGDEGLSFVKIFLPRRGDSLESWPISSRMSPGYFRS
jgi:hypothetical protein